MSTARSSHFFPGVRVIEDHDTGDQDPLAPILLRVVPSFRFDGKPWDDERRARAIVRAEADAAWAAWRMATRLPAEDPPE